jgi:ABC-type molybdate transport system permease subunit
MTTNPPLTLVGMAVGIVLGLAWAFGGFGAFLLVLVLGAIGFVVGRVAEGGEVNLAHLTLRKR